MVLGSIGGRGGEGKIRPFSSWGGWPREWADSAVWYRIKVRAGGMDKTGLIRRVYRKRLRRAVLTSRRIVLSSTISGNLSHVDQTFRNVIDHALGHVDPLPQRGACLGELLG